MKRVLLAACLFLVSTLALAQGIITGSIAGTVQDASGAVLAGASIKATRAEDNQVYSATAASDGTFSMKDLPVGTYTLQITSAGFANLTLNEVRVDSNRVQALGVEKLAAGGASTTVEVSTAESLLDTTQAQVTTTFDAAQLTDLPVAGGFDELTLLIPGVVATHGDNFSNTNGTGFSVNGQRGRSNNFELDGQSNNDNAIGGPQFFFSNDSALSEIQVITNNFGAQYGRNMGSVVNYITASGTNRLHGSATYRYSGDFTSSLDTGVSKGPQFGFCAPGQSPSTGCAPTVVPRYVSNIYGGTLGRAILKDKLYAFGSAWYQRFYQFGSLTGSGSSLFPTPDGLSALASAFPNSKAVAILQQLSPYAVKAGNPRQLTSIPVTNETVSDGTTTATIPFAPFARQLPVKSLDKELLGRVDYQATPKDRFYVRYIYQNAPTSPYSPVANGGFINVSDITHSVGGDLTHTFSSRWVDQLRYSFQQSKLGFDGGGFANCTITTFDSCPSSLSLGGLPDGARASGLGLASNLPQGRIVKVGQIQNNATVSLGHHAITFGGEFDYQNSPNVFLPNASGTLSFKSFDSFLQGGCPRGCTLGLTAGKPTVPFQEKDVALYFQDDWKVNSQFTANIGLRWEFFQQALNLLHDETVAQQTGPNPFWSTALPLSQTTFAKIPQSYRNFEPRIGFAYNPNFSKKLVVRGGFAMNVDPGFYNINLNSATAAPVVNAGTIKCDGVTVNCLPTGGATFATVQSQFVKFIPTGGDPGERNQTRVSPNFRQPYAETYTLGFQYQIKNAAVVEVRYTGNHTVGNFQSLDGNPYLQQVANDFPNVVSPSSLCTSATSTLSNGSDIGRLHCGESNVRVRANSAFSIYNGLQTSLTTKAYRGLTATFAYTYSRTIDNSSEIFGTFGAGNTSAFAQNPLNTDVAERNVSGNSFPNVASTSLTYSVPKFGSDQTILGKIKNGWQLNEVSVFNSGQPYNDFDLYVQQSPAANGDDPSTYLSYGSTQLAAAFNGTVDTARPILSNPSAPVGTIGIYTTNTIVKPTKTTAGVFSAPFLVDYTTGSPISPTAVHWISNNQYAARIAGNPYPGSGRNILRGNSYNNVDASIFKNTAITEKLTFRLEITAYNVLNRSFYGTPDNYMGDQGIGSFNNYLYNSAGGSLIGPGTGVRNMQFGGKFVF